MEKNGNHYFNFYYQFLFNFQKILYYYQCYFQHEGQILLLDIQKSSNYFYLLICLCLHFLFLDFKITLPASCLSFLQINIPNHLELRMTDHIIINNQEVIQFFFLQAVKTHLNASYLIIFSHETCFKYLMNLNYLNFI